MFVIWIGLKPWFWDFVFMSEMHSWGQIGERVYPPIFTQFSAALKKFQVLNKLQWRMFYWWNLQSKGQEHLVEDLIADLSFAIV